MKDTASTEAVVCIIDNGQEAKTEIMVKEILSTGCHLNSNQPTVVIMPRFVCD